MRQLVYRTRLWRRRQGLGQRRRQRSRIRLNVFAERKLLGAGLDDVVTVRVRPLARVHLHAGRTRFRNGCH